MNKKVFTAGGVEYAVVRPSPKIQAEAERVRNKAFREAIDNDALLRAKLDAIMRKQNLWDDEKAARQEGLQAEITEGVKTLGRGYVLGPKGEKTSLRLSEARGVAVKVRNLRAELRELLRERVAMDNVTAESQADNAKFNHLVASCLVFNSGPREGQRVYPSVDEYLEHGAEPHAYEGAGHLMGLLYGGDNDWESRLPENRFLARYHFIDDKLRYVNKEGRLTDSEGRLIDEQGRYVNEKNELVNRRGERVTEDGELIFEDARPFLDDVTGEPLAV